MTVLPGMFEASEIDLGRMEALLRSRRTGCRWCRGCPRLRQQKGRAQLFVPKVGHSSLVPRDQALTVIDVQDRPCGYHGDPVAGQGEYPSRSPGTFACTLPRCAELTRQRNVRSGRGLLGSTRVWQGSSSRENHSRKLCDVRSTRRQASKSTKSATTGALDGTSLTERVCTLTFPLSLKTSSQPWPYPSSLMLGAWGIAKEGSSIRTDLDNELEGAPSLFMYPYVALNLTSRLLPCPAIPRCSLLHEATSPRRDPI